MIFETLLRELVISTDGADGAIFLDGEGEAVQWFARTDGELLRLRAAYLTVAMQSCRSLATRLQLGAISHAILQYDGAWFVLEELERGYFLVLQLDASANLAQALEKIEPAAASLRQETAA